MSRLSLCIRQTGGYRGREMKVIFMVAWAGVAVAVGLGVLVWTASGSDASCGDDRLIAAMQVAIEEAERSGDSRAAVDMPNGCTDDDLATALPAVTRTWHVMPGGVLMREPTHTGP
jgi:hypothetical protein